MRPNSLTSLAIGVLGLLVGLWLVRPPATRRMETSTRKRADTLTCQHRLSMRTSTCR